MDVTLQDAVVGRVVDDRYLVESRIAGGGMATVYLALDRRLDREVALKVMHEHFADDQAFVARFVREARAAARLSHPNVVQMFDQGSDGSILYLAMEYLPGRTLREVLAERGALTPREALSVLEPVLDALGAAHRAGIVHRDVKPENVVMTDDGRIKVADFGLARASTAPVSGAARDGQLLGTVAYLAPELVSRGVADARADVYAAGIMLFEMLTGRQPYSGPDPVAVAYRHVHEQVPAPSSVAPVLPPQLDDVVLAATDREPDERPMNGDEMRAMLADVRETVPPGLLDVRATAVPGRTVAQTEVVGRHASPQQTQALVVPRSSRPPLVPRLSVHEDDDALGGGPLAPSRRRPAVALIAAAVAVLVALAAGIWYVTAGPGSYTRTPDVTGQRFSEARQELRALDLQSVRKEVFSDTVPSGQVASTDPAAGERVKKGGAVTLNVSKGPKLFGVPTLAGKSLDEAKAALAKAKLKLGPVDRKYDDDVDKGDVISSSPKKGQKVRTGTAVTLVVSRGPAPVEVPNLVNQPRAAAQGQLDGLGLKYAVDEVDYQLLGPAPGTVSAQDPGPGTRVARGATVRLTVVRGGGDANGQVMVPEVTNRSFDNAVEILRSQGFVPQEFGPRFDGQVRRQNPPAGTPVPAGSQVFISAIPG